MKPDYTNSIEESVVYAMDGTDVELFNFLPYLLQDSWEMGLFPEEVIYLIDKHIFNSIPLQVLDLGCGKGPVSIKIAKEFGFNVYGIDAVKEFISEADITAKKYNVQDHCKFIVGDIRLLIKELKEFDIVILGAIGSVLGNYKETLSSVSECLKDGGYIIIDNAYNKDDIDISYVESRAEISNCLTECNMILIDEIESDKIKINEVNNMIFNGIVKRAYELMEQFPGKKNLFENYINRQKAENEILETKLKCTTALLQKRILR